MDHVTFLTDPIWSERASPVPFAGPRRLVAPGLAFDALPPIDFVLISHNHFDHLDVDTLRALAARRAETRFFVPLGNAALLREAGVTNVEELDWGGEAEVRGLRILCLPSQHWSRRGLFDQRAALWASWAVLGRERRVYFAGDTGYFDGFTRVGEALGPFDVAALPIGCYEPDAMMRPWHLDPEAAARAGRELRAKALVPIHFGTFDLADEPLDEPPRRFREAARDEGFSDDATWVLSVGETRGF
jgi:N-acyl-phosphatidylethanolamine-hydrolysing phospholipase D